MKSAKNHAPKASQKLIDRAQKAGIDARVIGRCAASHRRYNGAGVGTTSSPQKVVEFNGIRMSLGQARQYLVARETKLT